MTELLTEFEALPFRDQGEQQEIEKLYIRPQAMEKAMIFLGEDPMLFGFLM